MILKIITMRDENRADGKTPEEGTTPDYRVTHTSWYEAKHIRHDWVDIDGKKGMQHQFNINDDQVICVDDNVMNAEVKRHIYFLNDQGKTIDRY